MLRRLLLALALSTALVSANVERAEAAPAVAAIGAFVATPLGGIVANVAIGVAANYAGTLIRQFTASKSPGSASASGIRGTAAGGDDLPISFVMGYRMTAGSFAYRGRWGSAGKTPNAYYVEERIISDLPLPNRPAAWIGDKKVTIDWAAVPTAQGYPILEGRVGGKDHWWVRYHDGTQTAADPYMLAKFSADPDHPYTADMIGRGQAKMILTFLVNKDLLKTWPKVKFETDGIALYDISKDSTAGGSGTHRLNNPATWEPSSLLPVHIYNILLGIRYQADWVWGGQTITAGRLPASSWIAAISEARALVGLAGGGTEQQYTGGFEITGDMEPQTVIKELLKGCAGRIAEIGGTFKMICGLPSSSVFSFTDRDVLVTREQGFDPYPVLEQTHNAIRATYPEPAAGWVYKDAPARYSSTLEDEDGGRQLAIDVRYEVVPSATQVQRLMKAAIEEARRFRRHGLVLPPEASELEPLDVVSWTSAEEGYTAKKFIITECEDEPTYLTPVSLQEIDPADHDYDPEVDQLPFTVGTVGVSGTPPQPVSEFGVSPWTHVDSGGTARRPGIKFTWDGDQVDVRALLYQVKLSGTDELVLAGEFASDFAVGSGTTPPGTVLSDDDYLCRGRYDPISTRETEWTAWQPVHTPPLPDVDVPPIAPNMLGPEMAAAHGFLASTGSGSLAELIATWEDQLDKVAGAVTTAVMTANFIRESLVAKHKEATAAVLSEQRVRAGETEALASRIDEVIAQLANSLAGGFLRLEAVVDPGGARSTIMAKAYAQLGGVLSQAAWIVRAEVGVGGDAEAYFGVLGTFHVFATPDGEPIPVLTVDAVTGEVSMNIANIGTVVTGFLRDPTDAYRFDIANGRFYRTNGTFEVDAKVGRIRIRKLVP